MLSGPPCFRDSAALAPASRMACPELDFDPRRSNHSAVMLTAEPAASWRRLVNLHRLAPYLYVFPALAALALWNYYPLLFLIDLSFHRLDASSPTPSWVGLANYRELFADALFWRVLRNTAI